MALEKWPVLAGQWMDAWRAPFPRQRATKKKAIHPSIDALPKQNAGNTCLIRTEIRDEDWHVNPGSTLIVRSHLLYTYPNHVGLNPSL